MELDETAVKENLETKTETEETKPEESKETETPETPEESKEPSEEPTEEAEEKVTEEAPQVESTEEQGNGVRVEDLVTKADLAERLSAFEAKFEAILAENKALTEKIAEMSAKYEEQDFGGFARQGVQQKDSFANETFESYSKQFL